MNSLNKGHRSCSKINCPQVKGTSEHRICCYAWLKFQGVFNLKSNHENGRKMCSAPISAWKLTRFTFLVFFAKSMSTRHGIFHLNFKKAILLPLKWNSSFNLEWINKTKGFTFIQQMQCALSDTQLPPLMHGLHHFELLTVTCTTYV